MMEIYKFITICSNTSPMKPKLPKSRSSWGYRAPPPAKKARMDVSHAPAQGSAKSQPQCVIHFRATTIFP